MPLGDLLYSGNVEMYGAFGTDLHLWNESTDAWTDTTQNLTAAPVNSGVAFKGTGTLKLKVAASIVAISSIHLLRIFMNAPQIDNDKIMWYVILHLTFVVSALLLGVLDRISFAGHRDKD